MTRSLLAVALAALLPLSALAAEPGFDQAVASIEQTYHVHRQHMPMIGLASFCAHVATGGAVQGIQIASFDDGARLPEGADLPAVVRGSLGATWSMLVETRARGEQDAVFARPHGHRVTLLVAAYDHGDLSVVRMDMNSRQFREWMTDPGSHARHAGAE